MKSFNNWELIFEHLELQDINNCFMVSKQFKLILDKNQYIWKMLVAKNYPSYLWISTHVDDNWKEVCRRIRISKQNWITNQCTKQEIQLENRLPYSNLTNSMRLSGNTILFESDIPSLEDQLLPISFNMQTKEWKHFRASRIKILSSTMSLVFVLQSHRCIVINSHTGQVCNLENATFSPIVAYDEQSNVLAMLNRANSLIELWNCQTGFKVGEFSVKVSGMQHLAIKFVGSDNLAVLRNVQELRHYNIHTGQSTVVGHHEISDQDIPVALTTWLDDDPNKICVPFFIGSTKNFFIWDMQTGERTHFTHPEFLKAGNMAANNFFMVGCFWGFMDSVEEGFQIVATNLKTMETKKMTVQGEDNTCYSLILHPSIKNLCLIHKGDEIQAIDLNTMESLYSIKCIDQQVAYGLATDGYVMACCSPTDLYHSCFLVWSK
mmetsp:Transcript_21211/g.29715  ORF Transcript_21211/g.29715 Transcript_21211/m.29715 type:complete len:435 (-) Transcript_21211:183-1487(-)